MSESRSVLSSLPGFDAVVSYYDSTWFDYRALWLNPRTRAIHFGYWGDGVRSHAESLLAMNRQMADAAGIRPGERVLDAGCGVGGSSLWLAEHYDARPTGIAPVASQIDRARRYAAERRLSDKVGFELGDFRAMEFPDESFDVVWIQEALVHVGVPDKHRFAAEAYRVLRPGGRLVITEYLRRSRPLPEADERLLGDWYRGWAMADLATRDELETCFVGAGFGDVRLDEITDKVVPSLRRLYRLSVGLFPIAKGLHLARIRDDAAHGNIVSSLKQWQALRRGLWSYWLGLAVKP